MSSPTIFGLVTQLRGEAAELALRELLDRGAVLMLAEAALDAVARARHHIDNQESPNANRSM